jgi:hypothetical protein
MAKKQTKEKNEDKSLEIKCNCGELMELATYESEEFDSHVGFECPNCNAALYGTFTPGEIDDDIDIE